MSRPKSLADAMKAVNKLHKQVVGHNSAGPFLEAVDWKAWNLPDYPIIIKHPMDLGLIQRKLDAGRYPSPAEYADDVRLVWRNCMTYNKEGSDYYNMAQKLDKWFNDKFAKIKWDASGSKAKRAPTLAEKRQFSQNVYLVGSATLGRVIDVLEKQCPDCIRSVNADDVEINIDSINAATFWEVNALVKNNVKRKDAPGAGGGGSKGKASEGPRKRQRKS